MVSKWDKRFLDLAQHFSTWSKDPSTQVGAVGVIDGRLPIPGYNGFPRGIEDTPERLDIRQEKYKRTIHAEMNVIYNASELGVSLSGATLYVYGLPVCSGCSLGIIQVGIKRVVMRPDLMRLTDLWRKSFNETADNFSEAGVDWDIELVTGELANKMRYDV